MNLQVAENATEGEGRVSASITRSSMTPQETVEVECMLQQCSSSWLYCYPRVRAHSTLLVCLRTLGTFGSAWPQRVLRGGLAVNRRVVTAVKHGFCGTQKSDNSVEERPSVDEQLTHSLYPGSEVALVSDSTVSMVDALLRHYGVSQGTTVFLPGLLLYPYFALLQLFDHWMLRVVGYDVDPVTMLADEDDIRRKALKLGLLAKANKKGTNSGRCRSLLLLIGLGGRFLVNATRMVDFARHELGAITVELHPVKAVALIPSEESKGSRMNIQTDVHITSMDAAGELGGAVAFAPDPLLSRGILAQLQKRATTAARRDWAMLTQHIAHVLLSDGISFQFVLQAVQLWSMIARAMDAAVTRMRVRGSSKRQQLKYNEEMEKKEKEVETNKKKGLVGQRSLANADKVFEFIMKPRMAEMCIPPISRTTDGNNHNDSTPTNNRSDVFTLSKLHRGVIHWMLNAVTAMQRRVERECFSLWEFLTHLRSDVEVVSCGEPHTPWNCVMGYSDNVMLRVRSPQLAAQALRTAGFDAVPAITHVWHGICTNDGRGNSRTSNNSNSSSSSSHCNVSGERSNGTTSNNGGSSQQKKCSLALREVILLPECPQCEALAHHILFLPLYPDMKGKNRQKVHQVMQGTFPSFLFKSPSANFIQHVRNTPNRHAYRSIEVTALIASLLQHRGGKGAFCVEPQPLLLWTLLGPVPGYLLSKL